MKVSAVSATIADSEPLMPSTEYRIRPSEAATSTMQMAMKTVEMRIMSRATPSGPDCPRPGERERRRHRSHLRSSGRRDLSINVDSEDQCSYGVTELPVPAC